MQKGQIKAQKGVKKPLIVQHWAGMQFEPPMAEAGMNCRELKELSGNLYENKWSALDTRLQSGNVYENKCSSPYITGMS